VSIDTKPRASARHIVRMPDIPIARCLVPCAADHVRQLVGNLRRDEISALRRRWMLRELLAIAADDLGTAASRWTPYYDAALRAARDEADALARHVDAPDTIVGFSGDDLIEVMIEWSLDEHQRYWDLLVACRGAGGRTVADAWDHANDIDSARVLLGAIADPETIREPLRRMAIAHMRGQYLEGAIARVYLDAARDASLGIGTWAAVEQAFAAWEPLMISQAQWDCDEAWHDHVSWMMRLPRQSADFEALQSYVAHVDMATLREALGNPFRDRRAA